MSKISFVLKRPGTGKDSAILVLFSCSDGRLKYYTGESGTNLSKIGKGVKAVLSRIERGINELAVDYKIKGELLTRQTLRSHLDVLLKKQTVVNPTSLYDAMVSVIDKMEEGELLTGKEKRYSPGSIKTLRFTADLLKRFNPGLTIQSITIETYSNFIVWMNKQNYSVNYIGSQIKNWKSMGKIIGGNPVFNNPAFKKIQENTFNIHLDEQELSAIYKLTLIGRYDIVRDWFILDCYTGLRVSDLQLLTDKNYSRGYITIANKKTSERVVIPAHRYVKEIIKKYEGFPPPAADVEINKLIKQIAEKAKINSDVLFTITKGGRRKDEYLKKWQMVSNHTARRSFITNLRKNGVADSIVMNLTGIKSPQTLLRYDKLSPDEAARIAAKHKFFN